LYLIFLKDQGLLKKRNAMMMQAIKKSRSSQCAIDCIRVILKGKRIPASENRRACHKGIVLVIANITTSTTILSGKRGPEAKSNK